MHFTGKLILEDEAAKVNKMLVSVFNAGKNGIKDPEIEKDARECYSYFINKVALPNFIEAYIKARNRASKEEIQEGVIRHRPAWIKMRNENKRLGRNLGQGIVHPSTFVNQDRWNDEVEGYTPTAREEVKTVHILTVEEIMTSKHGQWALKNSIGARLLDFVQGSNKFPDEDERRALWLDYQKVPGDGIDNRIMEIMTGREKVLKDKYWKGR